MTEPRDTQTARAIAERLRSRAKERSDYAELLRRVCETRTDLPESDRLYHAAVAEKAESDVALLMEAADALARSAEGGDRVAVVIAEMRARAAEYAAFPGVPCQTEPSWHVDELKMWADRLEGAPRYRDGSPIFPARVPAPPVAPEAADVQQKLHEAAEIIEAGFIGWSSQDYERAVLVVKDVLGRDPEIEPPAATEAEIQKLHCGNCGGTTFEIVPVVDGGEEERCLTCGESERVGPRGAADAD